MRFKNFDQNYCRQLKASNSLSLVRSCGMYGDYLSCTPYMCKNYKMFMQRYSGTEVHKMQAVKSVNRRSFVLISTLFRHSSG